MSGKREHRIGRLVAVAGAILLVVGIVAAVADLFRTSRPATATSEGGGRAEVRLNARDFNFAPHAVVVPNGRTVTIVLLDESLHSHTFTSPEMGVDVTLEPGESRTFTVNVHEAGQYGFYCRFHQSSGMRGYVQFRN
jgi:plastocyanin